MLAALSLFAAGIALAWANGANDNFKGVATLFGSGGATYRRALAWATATTLAGSIASVLLAQSLVARFSGRGLVPDELAGTPALMLAVALGAALTVLLATRLGLPVSTTHGLLGGLTGAGLVAASGQVNIAALGWGFVVPLLLSPAAAIALAGALYVLCRRARLRLGVSEEWCLCIGEAEPAVIPAGPLLAAAPREPAGSPLITVGPGERCRRRYAGHVCGVSAQALLNALHFASAGAVSFARGLNDTPKIAALLLALTALGPAFAALVVGLAMALGGLLAARRVAETMSRRITPLNDGQGFAANAVTAALVIAASRFGLPVSTTHVSCGALFGIGLVTGQADHRTVAKILLSWILTLPLAATLSALLFWGLTA